MCLENISEKKIAKRNIKCYKWLKKVFDLTTLANAHGKLFKAKIREKEVEGVISISSSGGIYFCQNHHDGADAFDKFGYEYSWAMDSNVSNIAVEGIEVPFTLITPYQEIPVEIGKTYLSEVEVTNSIIGEGLHSFYDLEDAIDDADDNWVIVECIIPKGSTYYSGTFIGWKSYASNELKYEEIVRER